MTKYKEQFGRIIRHTLPWFILAILLLYTYAKFFEHPYQGFALDSGGHVLKIYVDNKGQSLQRGDRLVQIGALRWDDFRTDLRKPLYTAVQSGEVVSLQIERDHQFEIIPWKFPGPTLNEIVDLAFNEGWLAYVFWFVGSLTLFNLRPTDERWRLMIGFNYLTAIWLVAGSGVSFYHIWESAIILRMAVWICVPVYLHLNWVFPKPLSKRPWQIVWGSYMVAIAFAIAEWFQVPPPNLYYSGFLLAIAGSAIFLILHAILQPEVRRDLRLLIIAALLTLLLPAVFGLLSAFSTASVLYGGAAILSLPFLPLGYLYASYRRQLGDLEVRVNRFISIYIFLILLGTVVLPSILWVDSWPWYGVRILVGVAAVFFTAFVTLGFPAFQTFVEKRLLGIRLAPAQLPEIYSARITTSTSSMSLQNFIRDDVLPSLLVRQFAYLQFDEHGVSKTLFVTGVVEEQSPCETDLPELIATAGKYRPLVLLAEGQPCAWVRLALPLKVGDKLIGLWLFGRRDPDDVYSQLEIPTLQSLANQTAIAQSNILQSEHLKALYLINIDRSEEERLNLALELHDSVLNQIALLMMNLDHPLPPGFQENYEKLTGQVRLIIGNLRPPMLNYGLKLAIEELIENLAERAKGTIHITMEIVTDDSRYPQNIEQHLFRIVQEACENAVRHAKARNIHISGRLDPNEINLKVEDDGIGFQAGEDLNLDSLLANKHFGLAGMKERAELIGAEVSIQSAPNAGTRIRITWILGNNNASAYR